jgi:hypothetical protein
MKHNKVHPTDYVGVEKFNLRADNKPAGHKFLNKFENYNFYRQSLTKRNAFHYSDTCPSFRHARHFASNQPFVRAMPSLIQTHSHVRSSVIAIQVKQAHPELTLKDLSACN